MHVVWGCQKNGKWRKSQTAGRNRWDNVSPVFSSQNDSYNTWTSQIDDTKWGGIWGWNFPLTQKVLFISFFDSLPNVAAHHLSTSFGCAINHEVITLQGAFPEILAGIFCHLLEACNQTCIIITLQLFLSLCRLRLHHQAQISKSLRSAEGRKTAVVPHPQNRQREPL